MTHATTTAVLRDARVRTWLIVALLSAVLVIFATYSITIGRYDIAMADVWGIVWDNIVPAEAPTWTLAVELGGQHGGTAAAICNTSGNAIGLIAPILTPAVSAWITASLAKKPTIGGTPASENMNTVITPATQGLRFARPAKSPISSLSKPWRDRNMISPKVPKVVST